MLPGSGGGGLAARVNLTVPLLTQLGQTAESGAVGGFGPVDPAVWARGTACSARGCRQPAARCDLDHTVPYEQGGRTCECNLAPLCRHHHRCKQAEGWRLEQPRPGVMAWATPAGRRCVTVARAG